LSQWVEFSGLTNISVSAPLSYGNDVITLKYNTSEFQSTPVVPAVIPEVLELTLGVVPTDKLGTPSTSLSTLNKLMI
jgi:hypothetical protein